MATAVDDLDAVLSQCQQALGEFVKGNPEPMQRMFSHREDVTLANPIAPPARGWEQVAATMERAVSYLNLRDGEIDGFEIVAKYVTPELAYVVWIERSKGKVGEREDIVLGRYCPISSSGYDDLSTRRGHLEDCASACRPDNHGSAS